MKLKMTVSIHDDTVSNYLFAQLCRTVVGEGEGGRGGVISETGWSTYSKI